MRSSFLWIFPIFLAGTNGLTCYFKDYRECIKAWGNELKVMNCLSNLTSKPKKCGNDEICSTVGLTLYNLEHFEQKDCVHRKSICNYNETYGIVTRLEELAGGFALKETMCGSCDSDLCNVTNPVLIDYGSVCFFTDTESCYRLQPNNYTKEAQLERFNCLRRMKVLRCDVNYTICYSKFYKFRDGSLLIIKGCANKGHVCSSGDYSQFFLYTVGMVLEGTPYCSYCDSNLCNDEIWEQKYGPKRECLVSHYRDCLTVPIAERSEDLWDARWSCMQNRMPPFREYCKMKCGSIFLNVKGEEKRLTIRICGEQVGELQKDIIEMILMAERKVTAIDWTFCNNEDFCNDVDPPAETARECYQSSLIPCLENLSLIIPQERLFECVKNMNLHKGHKKCKIGEKCTTIILHLESGDIIHYLTCGTGPPEVCVNMLKEINMEKFIGKKIVKAECEYCNNRDYCNTPVGEKRIANATSAKTIQCYLSDFEFCRIKLHDVEAKPSPTELKEIQEEMYECLRNNPLKTTTCHGCLTVTFFFEDKDKVIQAAFCDNVDDHLEKCDVHHMDRKYFFDLLGLKLEHWRCNRCLTPLCNNATISSSRKKSEEVVSLATTYRMYSFRLILICFNFVLLP